MIHANASLDNLLSPLEEARSMLRQGKLFWDIANECYCTPRRSVSSCFYRNKLHKPKIERPRSNQPRRTVSEFYKSK